MAGLSDILVRVGADVDPLKKGFKTAGDQVKDFTGKTSAAAVKVAAVTTAALAAGGALVAMAKSSADSAREIKNLAALSGTTTDRFQKLAFGAKSVGIEQDKLADIFKDTQDKVGDFLQTGGGPLADFFENIAPLVGTTAEEFKYLSGPEALQKYTSSLQAANLSQAEMTFYMEAIASDSTALVPLLAENGKGFETLAEKADKTGAVLSALDIGKLEEMNKSLGEIGATGKVAAMSFSAEFAPVIGALADEFTRLRVETNNFGSASSKVLDYTVKGVGILADGVRGIHVIIKGLEVAFHAFSIGVNGALSIVMSGIDTIINGAISGINTLIEGINKIPGIDDIGLLNGSDMGGFFKDGMDTAKNNMAESVAEMHDLMMQPLPSDKIETFVASAVEAYEKAAQAQAEVINNSPVKQALESQLMTLEEGHKKYARTSTAQFEAAEKSKADIQTLYSQKSLSAASKALGDISALMNTENRKQFEIGKSAASGQVVIDTISGAQAAYKSLAGIPVVGPALGVAAAGAATVAGLARLSQIQSTSFGSKSAPSAPTAAAAPSAAAEGGAGSAAGSNSTLFVEGLDPNKMYPGGSVRGLAEELLQYQRDGGEVVLT